jgi:hypothetical protein
MIQTVRASQVREGDFLPGLGNGYVFEEPVTNDGYLNYPVTGSGRYDAAMPSDTMVISFHDADGEECYLLLPAGSRLTVSHDGPERVASPDN